MKTETTIKRYLAYRKYTMPELLEIAASDDWKRIKQVAGSKTDKKSTLALQRNVRNYINQFLSKPNQNIRNYVLLNYGQRLEPYQVQENFDKLYEADKVDTNVLKLYEPYKIGGVSDLTNSIKHPVAPRFTYHFDLPDMKNFTEYDEKRDWFLDAVDFVINHRQQDLRNFEIQEYRVLIKFRTSDNEEQWISTPHINIGNYRDLQDFFDEYEYLINVGGDKGESDYDKVIISELVAFEINWYV